ncbi:hypothetical protein [Ruegeria marina]|uniref:Uncharacterized protein n=1 Tax=Ruegeria marina TaxID=639004 RepID=A0A1G6I9C0_9RHOB|nr:hypothetical protein [Ruegeria marina]SDC02605.1 hypothetical protein SAMN04488239_10151 [Ruegeria marina]
MGCNLKNRYFLGLRDFAPDEVQLSVGIATNRDLVLRGLPKFLGKDIRDFMIGDVMSPHPIT